MGHSIKNPNRGNWGYFPPHPLPPHHPRKIKICDFRIPLEIQPGKFYKIVWHPLEIKFQGQKPGLMMDIPH